MAHVHIPAMPAHLAGINAGQNAQSILFQTNAENFIPPLALPGGGNLNCVGCCWSYLVGTRGYASAIGVIQVYYGNPTVSCFVDGPQGRAGKHAVIQTGHDIMLGQVGNRPVQQSISFQLYYPPGLAMRTLAIGAPIQARIESISVTQLASPVQLQDCYFNYCNAALVELSLQRFQIASFQGTCASQPPQQPLPPPQDGQDNNGGDGVGGIADGLGAFNMGQ